MRKYNLDLGQWKSRTSKPYVIVLDDGSEQLYSYGTLIMSKTPDGHYIRHWADWSVTTQKDIKGFSGLCKKEFEELPTVRGTYHCCE